MRAAAAERVTCDHLVLISACLAFALLAHVSTLPVWVFAAVAITVALRIGLAARGRGLPARSVRFALTVLSIGWLFLQFRTFNGLSAGTALLGLVAGLKLLETQTRRDVYVVTMIIYFLSLSALLESESFWLFAYLVGVCWLSTATLLLLTSTATATGWRGSLSYTGRLLMQALPLALLFWLFFPRFGGPLWQMPDNGTSAQSGLTDVMSPGDITDLALSDDVAFRVRFDGAAPPAQERYWRGPVLHDFDGRTWRRTDAGYLTGPALLPEGQAYRYTVSIEPNQHNWLFMLDWPSAWDAPRSFLTSDYMLVQPTPIERPIDVKGTSYTHVRATQTLSARMRRLDLDLPTGPNPRTLQLARELRRAHPADVDYVQSVLDMFRQQPFYYTLTPPALAGNSVDAFLFDTRRGFCGHYASAFATLMRAAGIPARVVTGYQGGTFNRFANYWILRQSDAHAWDEIWVEGHGWLRIDPTSAIAPERVERGLNDLLSAESQSMSRWQQRGPWFADTRLRLDALRLLWRERILRFDQDSQNRLLTLLRIPQPDGAKLVIVLAAGLVVVLGWLTWAVRRELEPPPTDRVQRAYARLCRKLKGAGVERLTHEPAEQFAARVSRERPDLEEAVTALCRDYSVLRYSATTRGGYSATVHGADPHPFIAAVRAFRPRAR